VPGPATAEVALAAATATYLMAAVVLLWLGMYWLLRGAVRLIDELLLIGLSDDAIAWCAMLVWLGATMLTVTGRAAVEIESEFYPRDRLALAVLRHRVARRASEGAPGTEGGSAAVIAESRTVFQVAVDRIGEAWPARPGPAGRPHHGADPA
jgi:hypothetical protein